MILNIVNTHSIKLNMRAVEFCTMNVLKHKWHFWCIKLRVIVHNLLSSTIKLNGLWNQSEMWKETHLHIHTHILHNCTERSNEHAILIMYYLQMNKKSAGGYLSDEAGSKKYLIFCTSNSWLKSIIHDERKYKLALQSCFYHFVDDYPNYLLLA